MGVPFADLDVTHRELRADIDRAIAGVIDSGKFILGPAVASFETALAAATDQSHAVGVSSGSDALLVALMALGVGASDEVVTTPFTFFSTAGAIARLGARPVFVDIDYNSFNLDPAAVESAIGDKTRAVIPVHLFGRLASVPYAGRVPVVEDAAQSIGAGDVGGTCSTLSFFPSKNLGGMGDGGAVLTRDADFADRVRLLRAHGARPKYIHKVVGGNFRLDALQAAILEVKLAHLATATKRRQAAASRYRELFATADLDGVVLPEPSPEHVYNQFVVRVPRRDELRAFLQDRGIATALYYPEPLHLQECFADLGYRPGSLPVAEAACREVVALPIFPSIRAEQQEQVVGAVTEFLRG